MKADVIIKAAGVAVSAVGKVADVVSKGNSDQKKTTCDTAGKIIDASATIAKSVMDATQTTRADVELTEEYKCSNRLDKIVDAKIKLISEGKMTPEIEAQLNVLTQEEEARKEKDENRASDEKHRKRVDSFAGGSVIATIMGGFAMGIMLILKKRIIL